MNNLEKNILNSESTIQKEDWRKDLAVAKFEYQKQKDYEKQELKRQQLMAQQKAAKSQQTQVIVFTILKVLFIILKWSFIITMFMVFAPLVIGWLFFIGMIKGLAK